MSLAIFRGRRGQESSAPADTPAANDASSLPGWREAVRLALGSNNSELISHTILENYSIESRRVIDSMSLDDLVHRSVDPEYPTRLRELEEIGIDGRPALFEPFIDKLRKDWGFQDGKVVPGGALYRVYQRELAGLEADDPEASARARQSASRKAEQHMIEGDEPGNPGWQSRRRIIKQEFEPIVQSHIQKAIYEKVIKLADTPESQNGPSDDRFANHLIPQLAGYCPPGVFSRHSLTLAEQLHDKYLIECAKQCEKLANTDRRGNPKEQPQWNRAMRYAAAFKQVGLDSRQPVTAEFVSGVPESMSLQDAKVRIVRTRAARQFDEINRASRQKRSKLRGNEDLQSIAAMSEAVHGFLLGPTVLGSHDEIKFRVDPVKGRVNVLFDAAGGATRAAGSLGGQLAYWTKEELRGDTLSKLIGDNLSSKNLRRGVATLALAGVLGSVGAHAKASAAPLPQAAPISRSVAATASQLGPGLTYSRAAPMTQAPEAVSRAPKPYHRKNREQIRQEALDNLDKKPGWHRRVETFRYLRKQGFTPVQAAGFIGNFGEESGSKSLNPGGIEYSNGEGHGYAQWSGSRKAQLMRFAARHGKSWTDPSLQLRFAAWELNHTETQAKHYIQRTETVRDATEAIMVYYERPNLGIDYGHFGVRESLALDFWHAYVKEFNAAQARDERRAELASQHSARGHKDHDQAKRSRSDEPHKSAHSAAKHKAAKRETAPRGSSDSAPSLEEILSNNVGSGTASISPAPVVAQAGVFRLDTSDLLGDSGTHHENDDDQSSSVGAAALRAAGILTSDAAEPDAAEPEAALPSPDEASPAIPQPDAIIPSPDDDPTSEAESTSPDETATPQPDGGVVLAGPNTEADNGTGVSDLSKLLSQHLAQAAVGYLNPGATDPSPTETTQPDQTNDSDGGPEILASPDDTPPDSSDTDNGQTLSDLLGSTPEETDPNSDSDSNTTPTPSSTPIAVSAGDLLGASKDSVSSNDSTETNQAPVELKSAVPPFERSYDVPAGAHGHDVYYTNQVQDLDGIDGMDGLTVCALADTAMIVSSLNNDPAMSISGLHKSAVASGSWSDTQGVLNINKYLDFMDDKYGLKHQIILHERTSPVTDSTLDKVEDALKDGKFVMVHTSDRISGVAGGHTEHGHYFLMYAAGGGKYYVVNPAGQSAVDNGVPFTADQIKNWADGFYAVGKAAPAKPARSSAKAASDASKNSSTQPKQQSAHHDNNQHQSSRSNHKEAPQHSASKHPKVSHRHEQRQHVSPLERAKQICRETGTEFKGRTTGYHDGKPTPVYLCTLPKKYGGITVVTGIAKDLVASLEELNKMGMGRFTLASGFRSYHLQMDLRIRNGCPDIFSSPSNTCRVPTAIPGWSNHEEPSGAFDISQNGHAPQYGTSSWERMNAVLEAHGFINLLSHTEAWHYSRTGN